MQNRQICKDILSSADKRTSGSHFLTVEGPGSEENHKGFGEGISMSDCFISQFGQDVVRGHFLLSFKHRFWKQYDLGQQFPYHHSPKYPQTFH